MEMNRKNIRIIMTLIVFSLLLYFGLLNFGSVMQFLGMFVRILTPFIAGACAAFILNVPMRWIESGLSFLFSKRKKAKKPVSPVFLRITSLFLTTLIFAGVIVAVVFLVAPEVGRSINMIIAGYPDFSLRVEDTVNRLGEQYPAVKDYIANYDFNWDTIGQSILNFTKNAGGSVLSSTIGLASSIFGVVFSSIIAFVFAVNILLQKDKLAVQGRKIIYAFFPEPAADRTVYILSLSSKTFAHFVSGQGRESLILGVMFFAALSILQFPYALLTSILIAMFSLIPMFGAFIGFCFGEFFILIVDPVRAVWFILLFVILQQIEGNLIYPKVVGGSIGLPPIWVLVAVMIGGSLYGVLGMLIFIPLASVLYVLFRENVVKRLHEKQLQKEKISPKL